MTRQLFTLLAVATLTASPAQAGFIALDQEHDFVSGVAESTNGNVSEVGQTFTVGRAGTLDRIEVLMFRLGGIFDPTGDPVLSVYNTSGGVPTGAPLTTVSVPEAVVPLTIAAFVSFDVSAAAIPVDVGDLLAFGVSTSSSVGPYFFLVDADSGQPTDYADGEAVGRLLNPPAGPPDPWSLLTPSEDLGFRTFVFVPEPTTAALLSLGGAMVAALGLVRRRRSAPPRLFRH